MAASAVTGVVAYLKTDQALAALIGQRVFGAELPARETAEMPRKALVVRASGGASLFGASYVEHDTSRLDLFGFGETPFEAGRVIDRAALAMKRLRRSVHSGVLLHWAQSAGGKSSGREPATDWPREFQSFQVLAALEEVS
ncbi:MAG: DUF3168 domain-containing protein [Pseudomonadota bacterium]